MGHTAPSDWNLHVVFCTEKGFDKAETETITIKNMIDTDKTIDSKFNSKSQNGQYP